MKTTRACLSDIRPQLREILSRLVALDERAADHGDNAWLRQEIQIMRRPGRERDRRREVDEAADNRERGWQEITREYARLVGQPADEVVVDRAKITRVMSYVSNLLRESGDQNV